METSAQAHARRRRSSGPHRDAGRKGDDRSLGRDANQIVDWPSSHCFGCKRPIIVGQKWLELVYDDNRDRFHSDCEPAWRAWQEVAARRALWGGQITGGARRHKRKL
jgi:hypothetical protein